MGVPEPKVALDDACSTIYNNTLFSYSSKAFQSLQIEKGAQWQELDSGVSVTGGACVHATPPDNLTVEALYIVGGTSSNASYPGLQRYIFEESRWETLTLASKVTQNRLYHSAVYLNSSATILVYSGTQDGSRQDSSQTFTISTGDGHSVVSYVSDAPPTISPLLIPWTNSSAVLIGGSETNADVKMFTLVGSWVDTNITLATPLQKNSSMVQAVVTDGDDGSKSLYTFDMSVSPNQVNRTVLLDSGGEPVSNAVTVSRKMRRRDGRSESKAIGGKGLTVSDWPDYNSTFAPTSTRSGYSLAQDSNGLVVVSGGNTDDTLCLFSATENAWLNATSEFTLATKTQTPIINTSSSASAVSSTPAESSTSAAAAVNSNKSTSTSDFGKILGGVLGALFGFALLLVAILLFLRWRRKKREHAELGHQRRASGISDSEKDAVEVHHNYHSSFLDLDQSRGFQSHKAGKESQSSFSSMAILMGRVGQSGHKRGLGRNNSSTASSTSSMFNKKYKNAISNPIPQENGLGAMNGGLPGALVKEVSFESSVADPPSTTNRARASASGARRGSTRRSSGWNRYWSGGSGAMSILGFGSKRNTCSSGSDRSSNSQYSTDQKRPSQVTQVSALVPPLTTTGNGFGLSRVVSGSPTISHTPTDFPFKEGMSGQIGHSRNGSVSSEDSFEAQRTDAFSSGVPESVTEFGNAITSWDTPLQLPAHTRNPSSAYSASNYDRTTMGTAYGGVPSFNPAAIERFPTPPSNKPPVPEPVLYKGDQQQWDRGHQYNTSDMSWLNLGADGRRGI